MMLFPQSHRHRHCALRALMPLKDRTWSRPNFIPEMSLKLLDRLLDLISAMMPPWGFVVRAAYGADDACAVRLFYNI